MARYSKLGSDYLRAAEEDQARKELEAYSMASVNKVILLGNLGKDPELKHTNGGNSVCSFSIATSDKWTDSAGVLHEKTEWHRIVVWGKQAENAAKYLKKGKSAWVEGRLTTRSWDDASGQKRFQAEVVAENVRFMSPRDHAGE